MSNWRVQLPHTNLPSALVVGAEDVPCFLKRAEHPYRYRWEGSSRSCHQDVGRALDLEATEKISIGAHLTERLGTVGSCAYLTTAVL